MLIPYRVKNPVKRFPIVTLTIIGLNFLVYLFTTDYFMVIRESVVENYGFAFGISPVQNFFAAIFLHAHIFHILGNMLFLWVFGPPVEDRLGRVTYPLVYIATGFAGALLQAVIDKAVFGKPQYCIGASGCIMGIVGAYLFLFPWSKVCVYAYYTVFDVSAIWIVGFFFGMDLVEGYVGARHADISGGVANFAHVGGSLVGVLMCMAVQAKRDTKSSSQVKAMAAETKNLAVLPLEMLQAMLKEDPGNPQVIRALMISALGDGKEAAIDEAMAQAGVPLIEREPTLVAYYLIDLHGSHQPYPPVHLLRLASLTERTGDAARAINLYKLVVTSYPNAPETENALYRMAHCYWHAYKDAQSAKACLAEMERRFPYGGMSQFGKALRKELGQ